MIALVGTVFIFMIFYFLTIPGYKKVAEHVLTEPLYDSEGVRFAISNGSCRHIALKEEEKGLLLELGEGIPGGEDEVNLKLIVNITLAI